MFNLEINILKISVIHILLYIFLHCTDDVSVKPVDVVITGLNIILPLMTEDILKVASSVIPS